MSSHHVRIQLDAQPRFIVHLDEAALDVRAVESKHLVHPPALAGDRLQSYVVADGGRELDGGVGVNLAACVVVAHRQPVYVRQIGDPLGFQKPAGVPQIRVYDVGPNMELRNGRLFGKEEGRGGVPDGMRVDARGNVYCTGPGGVWVWDPDGNHLGTVMLPESTANFNWGDADYRTIYFSSRTSIYRLKTKAKGFVPGAH